MTDPKSDPSAEASDADLADQTLPVDEEADEAGSPSGYTAANVEADTADLIEQQQELPPDDDDYDR